MEGRNSLGGYKSFDLRGVDVALRRLTLLTRRAQGLVSFVNLSRYVGGDAGIRGSVLNHFDVLGASSGGRRDAHACLNICKGPIFINVKSCYAEEGKC